MDPQPIEEQDQQELGASAPTIPNLKKKDKERKRAGAAWGGARPGGTPFVGATGGSGAAGIEVAGGASQVAAGAAEGAGTAGAAGSSTAVPAGLSWIGGGSASFLSRAMVGLGVAAVVAGLGIYAYIHAHAKPILSAALGPISDPIKVHRGLSDERLAMAAQAGHGQFQFDNPAAPAAEAPAGQEKGQEQTTAPDKPADNPWGDILSAVQSPRGFEAQSIPGMNAGGGRDIFSALTGAGARGASMPALHYPGQQGRMSGAFSRGARGSSLAAGMRSRSIRSQRAFGQLRFARGLSLLAARGATSEQAMKTSAADAFDQSQTQGGDLAQVDSPVPTSQPPGSGAGGEYGGTAPLLSDPNALPPEPTTPQGAVDPGQMQNYQGPMNAIQQLASEAAELKMISMILIAIGVALIAAGFASTPFGWGLIAAGTALVAVGVMMLMMSQKMGAQAQALSAALAQAEGQQYEQQDVNACVQQAMANGTPTSQCQSPVNNNNTDNTPTTVSQDVNAERGSTWEYNDGQPATGSGN